MLQRYENKRLCSYRKYAYTAPSTPALQYKAPPLSHAQAAPLAHQHRAQHTHSSGHVDASYTQNVQQGSATHPRPQSRFKPAEITHNSGNQTMDLSNLQRATDQEVKRLRSMGPPPTPQHLRHRRETETYANGNGNSNNIPAITTNRFLSSSIRNTPTANNRRFIPPPSTPLNGSAPHPSNATTNGNMSHSKYKRQ